MEIVILVLQVTLLKFREFYFSLPVMNKLVFISRSSVSTFSCTFILMKKDSGLLFKILAALNSGRIILLCLMDGRVDHVTYFNQQSVNSSVSFLSRSCERYFLFSLCCETRHIPCRGYSFYVRPTMKMMWSRDEANLLMNMNCE